MILGHGERPARVVTRAGRPIADVAAATGIEVVTVERANADPAAVVPPGADLGVSMAWGELIGHDLLARPALGWLNAHPSALPA